MPMPVDREQPRQRRIETPKTGMHAGPGEPLGNLALGTAIAAVLFVTVLEIGLRFLPVIHNAEWSPVDADRPVWIYRPNVDITWPRGPDFNLATKRHSNNAGFLNNQDYASAGPRPLLAVVGDDASVGNPALVRVDDAPNWKRWLLNKSRLAAYLVFNLEVAARLDHLIERLFVGPPAQPAPAREWNRATDLLLPAAAEAAGVLKSRIVFVVEGARPDLYKNA